VCAYVHDRFAMYMYVCVDPYMYVYTLCVYVCVCVCVRVYILFTVEGKSVVVTSLPVLEREVSVLPSLPLS
jgi:hypothetical protein